MTKMNTLEMMAGNLLISKILKKTKLNSNKLRSFEDFIVTFSGSIDADLLLIWMNNFQLRFHFCLVSCLYCVDNF